ncbi:MAG: nucleotidyl transferase AbiEii/AbiGii toxin family protein [Gammaproteobacteria bacterium]|jgi:hypothetical protein|nr:nucleotidyl transferase AbiEii/AbiGii toxin family protein [Gammaproteobacteria bacterium]
MQNSRMKDFYDLWIMTMQFSFDGTLLAAAIRATFKRRRTDIPNTMPTALSEEFSTDEYKIRQWNTANWRSHVSNSRRW